MVVFTCNHCGESLQKPKVEKHYNFVCRNVKNLTCVDCFKDFRGEEYAVHTKCCTEEERYAAKGSHPNGIVKKGEIKQESWLSHIRGIINKEQNLKPSLRNLLNVVAQHNNIPRKKNKFINYLQNSVGRKINIKDIEEVWTIIESHKEKETSTSNDNVNEKGMPEVNNAKMVDGKNSNEQISNKTKNKRKNKVENNLDEPKLEDQQAEGGIEDIEKASTMNEIHKNQKTFSDSNTNVNVMDTSENNNINMRDGLNIGEQVSNKKKKKRKNKAEYNLEPNTKVSKTDNSLDDTEKVCSIAEMSENNDIKMTSGLNGNSTEELSNKIKKKRKNKAKNNLEEPKFKISKTKDIEGGCNTTDTNSNVSVKEIPENNVMKKKKKSIAQSDEGMPDINDQKTEDCLILNGNQLNQSNIKEFNVKQSILSILEEKGTLSVKKLEKKVLKSYKSSTGDTDNIEKVTQKFHKKLKKLPVQIVGDQVCLMLE